MSTFEVTFLGTSGSVSFNAGNRAKYGTNTSCVMVKIAEETLIFDAGTGLAGVKDTGENISLFMSHYHADHVNGLLFFQDFFNEKKRIDIYADYEKISASLKPPLNPVGFDIFKAKIKFHESGKENVRSFAVSHPGGALGFRLEHGGKSFCFCPDMELANHENDSSFLEFISGADLLVLDSYFDEKAVKGWGHSSACECAEFAKRANVKRLALFHHDFKISDEEIDARTEKAKKIFPNTFAAADFTKVEI
jgi:ribonuclease BN (tRNA processing enzyme)